MTASSAPISTRSMLICRDSAAARGLHLRAAEWFAGHAFPAPALDHATAAEDWPGVVEILRQGGLGLLLSGDGDSVVAALSHLPADLTGEPTIALTAAAAALCDHDLVAAREQLDMLKPQADAGDLTPYHAALLIAEARLQGTVPDEIDELAEAARNGGGTDVELLALSNRGMLHTATGDYAAAAHDLSAARQLTRGRERAGVDCLSHLAWNSLVSGDLPAAVEFADQAVALASRSGAATGPQTLAAYLVRAWAAWQQMDVRSAEQLVSVAGTIGGDTEPSIRCALELLGAYVACGQTVGKRSALARLQRDSLGAVASQLPPVVLSTYCLAELRLALSACDEAWAAEVMEIAESKLEETRDAFVLDALVRANHGRSGVRRVLDTALSADAARHSLDAEIAGWVLLAHLADENGEPVRAHDALLRSLNLAGDGLSTRELTAAPERVLRLMSRARGRFGEREELVEKVLRATTDTTGPMRPAYLAGEALTQREIEVLRDLPSMLSLSEIADAHVVSVNTVKTHLKAIYRKLAVTSRRGAVTRARDAGLL